MSLMVAKFHPQPYASMAPKNDIRRTSLHPAWVVIAWSNTASMIPPAQSISFKRLVAAEPHMQVCVQTHAGMPVCPICAP